MKPRRVALSTVYQGKYFRYDHVSFRDQDGIMRSWEMVGRHRTTPVVVIFAITENGELILEKQYRPPLDRFVLELPAGLKEKRDTTYAAAAKRELREETGWLSKSMRLAGTFPLSAGMSGDIIHFFVATKLKAMPPCPEEGEHIEVLQVPLSRVISFLQREQKKGCLIDPYVHIGLSLYRHR